MVWGIISVSIAGIRLRSVNRHTYTVWIICYLSKKQQKDTRIAGDWNVWNSKETKTHLLPFWNTDQNMCCKILLTKILNWTAGCELWSGPPGRRPWSVPNGPRASFKQIPSIHLVSVRDSSMAWHKYKD